MQGNERIPVGHQRQNEGIHVGGTGVFPKPAVWKTLCGATLLCLSATALDGADAPRALDVEGTAFIGFTRESADTFHRAEPPRPNPPAAAAAALRAAASNPPAAATAPKTVSRRSGPRRAKAARSHRAKTDDAAPETSRKRSARKGLFYRLKMWWKTHVNKGR